MATLKKAKIENNNNNNATNANGSAESHEEEVLKAIKENPEGAAQSLLEERFGKYDWFQDALNSLYQKTLVIIYHDQAQQIIFRACSISSSTRDDLNMLNDEERTVFRLIISHENMGISTKDLKNLVGPAAASRVVKICKILEKRQLIKAVPCVNKTGKVWMAFEIEPAPEISGDIWFHEGELDEEFIDHICENIIEYLRSSVSSAAEVFTGLRGSLGAAKETHIQQLLNVLKWEGKVEAFEDSASGTTEIRYRLRPVQSFVSGITKVPCNKCPHFAECAPESIVNSRDCIYLKDLTKILPDIEDLH